MRFLFPDTAAGGSSYLRGIYARKPKFRASWRIGLILLFLPLIFTSFTKAQISEVDRRKVDEIILMDISGSMVNDIRAALVEKGLATGRPIQGYFPPGSFQLAKGLTIEGALADSSMMEVVTNNLLFKVILYAEAIIDQPGPHNIHLVTFDDGPIDMGIGSIPGLARLPNHILGPFIITDSDTESNSKGRRRLKSLLAPDRNGADEALPGWRGILPEAVLNGSGPTAIHRTCLTGLNFLENLIVDGYTNTTKLQKMILFTDGLEEKDKNIPFTRTIDFLKLHRTKTAFEFNKYFILRDGETLPPQTEAENNALKASAFPAIQLVKPRTIRVTMNVDGAAFRGELEQAEDPKAVSRVVLSPSVRFHVSADDGKPLRGWLKFKVNRVTDLSFAVEPAQMALDQLDTPFNFTLSASGEGLKSIFGPETRFFDKLLLDWVFFGENGGLSGTGGGDKLSVAFYGPDRWPISLELRPNAYPVDFRCLQPAGIIVSSGKRVEISQVAHKGAVAVFEADFSKAKAPASVLVRLQNFKDGGGLRLSPGPGDQVLLSKGSGSDAKAEFSLVADVAPGTVNSVATIEIIPQTQRLTVNPSNMVVTAAFAPSDLKLDWLAKGGEAAKQPAAIDFGVVYMQGVRDGLANMLEAPSTHLLTIAIPDGAAIPAAEWTLTGTNPEAFRVVPQGEAGGEGARIIDRSGRLDIQVRHVFYDTGRGSFRTNLTATLEIRTKGNYVFKTGLDSAGTISTNLILVPLAMNAMIQIPERNKAQ